MRFRPNALLTTYLIFNMRKLLKSRTVWTIVVLFLINGVAGIHDAIPSQALPFIDGLLGILGIYFRVSPKQQF